MDKSQKSFPERILFIIVGAFSFSTLYAQPNCWAYKYYGDTLKYEACLKAEETDGLYQFSKAYQQILDEAIQIDSTFAYAYARKSTAYLKSGDFIIWMQLMNKAVHFNPQDYLGKRGYLRYLCFRDYKGALRDIEQLDSLVTLDLGYTAIGKDHLVVAKALCYKSLGENEKAIQILEKHLNRADHVIDLYDYLHLGVLYLEQKHYSKALDAFAIQSKENEIAENQYYLALTYKALNKKAEYFEHLKEAKALYVDGRRMFQDYIDPIDKVYLEDIDGEMGKGDLE